MMFIREFPVIREHIPGHGEVKDVGVKMFIRLGFNIVLYLRIVSVMKIRQVILEFQVQPIFFNSIDQ